MVKTGDKVSTEEMTKMISVVTYAAPPSTFLEEAELLGKCKLTINAMSKHEMSLSWQVYYAYIRQRMGHPLEEEELVELAVDCADTYAKDPDSSVNEYVHYLLNRIGSGVDFLAARYTCLLDEKMKKKEKEKDKVNETENENENEKDKDIELLLLRLFRFNVYLCDYPAQIKMAGKLCRITRTDVELAKYKLWQACSCIQLVSRGVAALLKPHERTRKLELTDKEKLQLKQVVVLFEESSMIIELKEPDALLFISMLENLEEYDYALKILEKLPPKDETQRIKGRILALQKNYSDATAAFQGLLEKGTNDWKCFLDYLDSLSEDASLSREKLDTASAFVKKLQQSKLQQSTVPHWADIEIEFRKSSLDGVINNDGMQLPICEYFGRFGHLPTFISDIEKFLEVLVPEERRTLCRLLRTYLGEDNDEWHSILKRITLDGIEEWFGFPFELSSVNDIAIRNLNIGVAYVENLQYKDYLDFKGGQDLYMASSALVQLFWRTKNVNYLVEAIMVLEFGSKIHRSCWQFTTSLMHLYTYIGALPLALERYQALKVNNILWETFWEHIVPGMLASPHLQDLGGLFRLYLGFMDYHLSDVRQRTFEAYASGQHSRAIELGYFTRRLKTSHQYVISEVESIVLMVKKSVEKFGELKEMEFWSEELQNQAIEKSKSVTLNDDPRSRPWWTPTPNVNHLKGTFDGRDVVYKNRIMQCDESLRRSYWSRTIERRSLLLSLITYALKSPPVCGTKVFSDTSDKILKLQEINNKYLESLELTRGDALHLITKVAEGKPFENEKVDIISLMTYGVFSSEDTDQLGTMSRMISKFVADKLGDKQLPISFRGDDLALLSQVVAEPLAWMSLLFQVCIEFFVSNSKKINGGKKKLKDHPFIKSIKSLIGGSTEIIDGIETALKEVLAVQTGWQDFPFSGVKEEETGPGQFIKILASSDLPAIQDVKGEWSCETVKEEILSAQRKTLEGILMICKLKKSHLRSLKVRKV